MRERQIGRDYSEMWCNSEARKFRNAATHQRVSLTVWFAGLFCPRPGQPVFQSISGGSSLPAAVEIPRND
jgi:hypothetical protein